MALSSAYAETRSDADPAYDQAREDYRVYLRELKKLGRQYKAVTGEMKQVIREEGLPVWDEEAGTIRLEHEPFRAAESQGGAFRVMDEKDRMVVRADLPGLKKETIKVNVQNGRLLRISAQRKPEGSPVERSIELPHPAAEKGQKASYEDGVLEVTLPKAESSKNETTIPVR